uniref:Uncharacterized protein n=1 Tax=Caenorhabditis japonica TaxID=281687 RepID=A0A8R1IRJ8_CAEJA
MICPPPDFQPKTIDFQNHDDADSDFSDDEECPQMTVQEERRMFEREQQIAFSGRCTIGDPD